jgi:hypothetical protein
MAISTCGSWDFNSANISHSLALDLPTISVASVAGTLTTDPCTYT